MNATRAPTGTSLSRLAWRSLWRQRRRTTLLITIVAYATFSNIFMWGFTDGFLESMLTGHARLISSPVLVATPAYRDDPDPEHALPDLDFRDALRQVPGVGATALRLEFPALLRSAYASQGVLARGIEPAQEGRVSHLPAHVRTGRTVANPGEVVLGRALAARLDARLGERVVLDAAGPAGPHAAGLVVVGLIESKVVQVDEGTVLVHLDDARRLTGVTTATGVALDAPRGREDAVARAVQAVLPEGISAYSLTDLIGFLRVELVNERIQMAFILFIFALFAAAAVTSTILVSVIERTREFGVISALGLGPRDLSRLVTLEAALGSAIGWALGLVLGYALTLVFGRWNILGPVIFPVYGRAFVALGVGDELFTTSRPDYGVYATVTIVLAALFTLAGPARRLRRLNPAQAMRVE